MCESSINIGLGTNNQRFAAQIAAPILLMYQCTCTFHVMAFMSIVDGTIIATSYKLKWAMSPLNSLKLLYVSLSRCLLIVNTFPARKCCSMLCNWKPVQGSEPLFLMEFGGLSLLESYSFAFLHLREESLLASFVAYDKWYNRLQYNEGSFLSSRHDVPSK